MHYIVSYLNLTFVLCKHKYLRYTKDQDNVKHKLPGLSVGSSISIIDKVYTFNGTGNPMRHITHGDAHMTSHQVIGLPQSYQNLKMDRPITSVKFIIITDNDFSRLSY